MNIGDEKVFSPYTFCQMDTPLGASTFRPYLELNYSSCTTTQLLLPSREGEWGKRRSVGWNENGLNRTTKLIPMLLYRYTQPSKGTTVTVNRRAILRSRKMSRRLPSPWQLPSLYWVWCLWYGIHVWANTSHLSWLTQNCWWPAARCLPVTLY